MIIMPIHRSKLPVPLRLRVRLVFPALAASTLTSGSGNVLWRRGPAEFEVLKGIMFTLKMSLVQTLSRKGKGNGKRHLFHLSGACPLINQPK